MRKPKPRKPKQPLLVTQQMTAWEQSGRAFNPRAFAMLFSLVAHLEMRLSKLETARKR